MAGRLIDSVAMRITKDGPFVEWSGRVLGAARTEVRVESVLLTPFRPEHQNSERLHSPLGSLRGSTLIPGQRVCSPRSVRWASTRRHRVGCE